MYFGKCRSLRVLQTVDVHRNMSSVPLTKKIDFVKAVVVYK
jgi:hypothetical protein